MLSVMLDVALRPGAIEKATAGHAVVMNHHEPLWDNLNLSVCMSISTIVTNYISLIVYP